MDEGRVLEITGLTANERKRCMHFLIAQGEETFAAAIHHSVKQYHQLQDRYPEMQRPDLRYCALVLETRKIGWDTIAGKGYREAGEEQFRDLEAITKAKVLNLTRKNQSKKKQAVLAYWGEVVDLKKEGIGFIRIARYLNMQRKVKVSPTYLHRLWCQFEKKEG